MEVCLTKFFIHRVIDGYIVYATLPIVGLILLAAIFYEQQGCVCSLAQHLNDCGALMKIFIQVTSIYTTK